MPANKEPETPNSPSLPEMSSEDEAENVQETSDDEDLDDADTPPYILYGGPIMLGSSFGGDFSEDPQPETGSLEKPGSIKIHAAEENPPSDGGDDPQEEEEEGGGGGGGGESARNSPDTKSELPLRQGPRKEVPPQETAMEIYNTYLQHGFLDAIQRKEGLNPVLFRAFSKMPADRQQAMWNAAVDGASEEIKALVDVILSASQSSPENI